MIKINNKRIGVEHFPDGTQKINISPFCYMFTVYGPRIAESVTITWEYDNDSELITLVYVTKHLRSKGINDIRLYMPYIPNARFDRVKEQDEVFTLKYFADIINSLKFNKITALDPHSHVCEALLDNFQALSPIKYIEKILADFADPETILYFPDEGAMKRYADISKKLHLPFIFGIKNRDWKTGKINGIKVEGEIEDITNKPILIVDDICSKGGTFFYSAKALKAIGAGDISLYISHCENTILEGELINSGLVKHIYTTNSIYRETHPLITVLEDPERM